MRTTIELNDNLVDQAMRLTGIETRHELIDFSFRELIRQRQQAVRSSLPDMFAELRTLNPSDDPVFPETTRQNRPNPFAEDIETQCCGFFWLRCHHLQPV
ncbi:MAG: type II toxin-antitoxin system VapB family antitoxin [Pseudomonadota bacterium]